MPDLVPHFTVQDTNRQVILVRRPVGVPLSSDFMIRTTDRPTIGEHSFVVRNLYLSADPVQRGWAANPELTPLGTTMRGLAVGVIVESRDASLHPGDVVYGFFGWQDYAVARREDLLSHIPWPRMPVSAYAGVLGMPGVTAWLALQDLAPLSKGAAILVSTAAGAVGSVVGQIARRHGAFAIGLTGSDEKVARCTRRFGYDAAINYRTANLAAALADVRPEGFDIYFDNTGGDIADTAIRAMARYGRIIQCGTAATATWNPAPTGLRNEREILTRVLTWSGFYIFDHVARFGDAIAGLTDLMLSGGIEHDEEIDNGIEHAPAALETLFAGRNAGKKLIFVGEA